MKKKMTSLSGMFKSPSITLLLTAALTTLATTGYSSTRPYITDHQINFGTGNKYLQKTDISVAAPGPRVSFTRTYNSQSNDSSVLGHGWTAPHTERLIIDTDKIILIQKGGRYVHFPLESADTWVNETGSRRVITRSGSDYLLTEKNGTTTLYDTNGKITLYTDRNGNTRTYTYDQTFTNLTQIENNFGAILTFSYEPNNRISTVTGPQGTYTYGYDANNNLTSITYPDTTTTITYIYDDPNDVHNLTGIINEENERILTVEYDGSDRATRSVKQGGVNEVTIGYPSETQRTVTDSMGVVTTYNLDVLYGVVKVGSFSGPGCSSCGSTSDMSYLYDDRFRLKQKTDAKGTITEYSYDTNGNKLSQTEALGTPLEKITTYTYTSLNQVATISSSSLVDTGQNSVTTNSYGGNGNLESRTETGFDDIGAISRTTAYGYTSLGQLESIDGPRTDVNDDITLAYYPNDAAEGLNRGQLHTVTNSLGHVTTYEDYTVHGQAETITDANGLVTTRTFDTQGRLLSSTSGGLTTGYTYDKAGDLLTVTRPGNRTITYGYDAEGRVQTITDTEGNSITYSYDTESRKTAEEVKDPQGTLTRTIGFEYDDAGRVDKVLLPGDAERIYEYDEIGNLARSVNATGLETNTNYDLLSRLENIIEDVTPDETTTAYSYDANNNLTSVTDDRGMVTSYIYDDFNRRISRTSPETGLTLYAYDEAGNIGTISDALNRIVSFTYDALNRPLTQSYGSTTINFLYDQNANGKGRLSSITDEFGTRSFSYNTLGQLTNETRTISGQNYDTVYGYSSTTGDRDSITYPSGTTVEYSFSSDGQINAVTVDGTTVINSITRLPFGPLKTATLSPGSGDIALTRNYDLRYNLMGYQTGSTLATYTRDKEGHVTTIEGIPSPTPENLAETSTYDTSSNKLNSRGTISYIHDAVGNITSDGNRTFSYDELNRITEVQQGSTTVATYGYDSSNRRIVKTTGTTTTHYLYDSGSNLIGESQPDGTPIRDYIYLDGELLAQKVYGSQAGLYFYSNDHLGTPQKLIASDGTVVWEAAYLPFGKAQVITEQITNNIRFPGQYYDAETGLHYNWHRFYDPATGRYISADPIGLGGGMNLYAYVGNNPINKIDPFGLCEMTPCMKQCLESILGSSIDDIEVTPDSFFASLHGSNTLATTRENSIYLNISCEEFLNDLDLVLHEYYHVVHQWNTGDMTTWDYVTESMENGYWDNKYEIAARNFASANLSGLKECIKCCEQEY